MASKPHVPNPKTPKTPKVPTIKQTISQAAFGHVQGKRQSTADSQIAALVKQYDQQQKASAAQQKAFGLKSVSDSTGTGRSFHTQSQPFHRYP